jgi:hypothetical protein
VKFEVILEIVRYAATVGSTRDTIEASTAAEAEAKAIELWREADPTATYRPLLTTPAA